MLLLLAKYLLLNKKGEIFMKQGIINAAEGIIDRAVTKKSSKKKLDIEDIVIITIQNSLIRKASDICYLLSDDRIETIDILLRSMLEQYAYLCYILESHTKTRATLFMYSYKIQKNNKVLNIVDLMETMEKYNTDESAKIKQQVVSQIQKDYPNVNTIEEYISELKNKYDDLIVRSISKTNKAHYEKWYNVNGKVGNMRDLMRIIGMDDVEYEFMYGLSSMNVHGIDAFGKAKIVEDDFILESVINNNLTDLLLSKYLLFSSKAIIKHFSVGKDPRIKEYMKQIEINYKFL